MTGSCNDDVDSTACRDGIVAATRVVQCLYETIIDDATDSTDDTLSAIAQDSVVTAGDRDDVVPCSGDYRVGATTNRDSIHVAHREALTHNARFCPEVCSCDFTVVSEHCGTRRLRHGVDRDVVCP